MKQILHSLTGDGPRRSLGSAAFVAIFVVAITAATLVAPASAADADTVTLSGHVSLGDSATSAAEGEVRVKVHNIVTVLTDASGNWSAEVAPGKYSVRFEYLGEGPYSDGSWPTGLPVIPTQVVVGDVPTIADVTLPVGGSISGRITRPDGSGLGGSKPVMLTWRSGPNNTGTAYTYTDNDGNYTFRRQAPGNYRVSVVVTNVGDISWGESAWNPVRDYNIPLASGENRTGIDFQLITTTVSVDIVPSCRLCALGLDWTLTVEALNPATGQWVAVRTWPFTGRTTYRTPYAGRYRMSVQSEYWPGGMGSGSAEIDLTSPTAHLSLPVKEPTMARVAGANRYETAVGLSKNFGKGVPVAYVVNGLTFADGLSAGPAAAHQGGPVLLVTPTELPSSVRAELTRLKPKKIVIVGGPTSVNAAVETQLKTLAPVVRVAGANRYETSRALAQYAFGDGTSAAFVTTGLNFPDALSAGPAAAKLDAPIITVRGTDSTADSSTVEVLNGLGVEEAWIIGSGASVNEGIAETLRATGITVERLGGQNRYVTSLEVSRAFFETVPTVFLASGENFPDALAGGATAGKDGSALLVIPGSCVPVDMLYFIRDRGAQHVVILGSETTVEEWVDDLPRCWS